MQTRQRDDGGGERTGCQEDSGPPRAVRWMAHAALLLGTALAGCKNREVASANLDALHDSEGRYHYRARLLTPTRALFSGFVLGIGLRPDSLILRQKEKSIKNPARETLDNLLELADGPDPGAGSASLRAHRVRQYAYLGIQDPSALVRERALIELGYIAAGMGLEGGTPPPEEAANAPELSTAIAGLAEVVRPLVSSGGPFTDTQRADLAAACEVFDEMVFDVEGAHRLLAVTAAVLDHRERDGVFAPVAELSGDVERTMVRQALQRSLGDEMALARAAAFEANWRAYGDAFLREALRALVGAPPADDALFGLRPVWAGDDELFVTVLRIVRENGLPAEEGDREARKEYLYALTSIAVQYTLFSDRTRNAAMLALSEVSGAGMKSLRLEDWQRWWEEFEAAEAAASRPALSPDTPPANPGAGAPDPEP